MDGDRILSCVCGWDWLPLLSAPSPTAPYRGWSTSSPGSPGPWFSDRRRSRSPRSRVAEGHFREFPRGNAKRLWRRMGAAAHSAGHTRAYPLYPMGIAVGCRRRRRSGPRTCSLRAICLLIKVTSFSRVRVLRPPATPVLAEHVRRRVSRLRSRCSTARQRISGRAVAAVLGLSERTSRRCTARRGGTGRRRWPCRTAGARRGR